jgi:hypothetical protein
MKYTSAVGNFFFPESTPIALAQLVRDTVTVAIRSPKPGDQLITNADTARQFIRNHSSKIVAQVEFDLVLL